MKLINYFLSLIAGIYLFACNSTYTSKKEGFYKIEMPQKKYRLFNEPGFPYSFEYPEYANIVKDSTYFDASPENNYWRNIDFPGFDAKIFLSYKQIGGKALYKVKGPSGKYRDSFGINYFDKMVNDAFNLTNKNDDAATSKKVLPFSKPGGVSGIVFQLGGNAATARQFFMTDSSKNFLRGALYFYAPPNADSLRPMVDFLQKDIDHLINTFHWKPAEK